MVLEVLVAAMGQTDLSLAEKMNLKDCNAVIANQCDRWSFDEKETVGGRVRMISTATRGVGTNRNLALEEASGDILLFADDDMVYYDGALEGVKRAFEQLPDADVICFGIDMTKEGIVFDERRHPVKRLSLFNALKFGTCRTAVRRSAVAKGRLRFSTLFGGGAIYSSGEDSLFLRDCFKRGLRVYSHSHVLGTCAKDGSSWFHGFDEKYLFDKGAWICCAFPKLKHLIKWYFIYKFSKKAAISFSKTADLINAGIKAFPRLEVFSGGKEE